MLRPRIIPALLVQDSGLVKTVRFESPRYIGDPINAVKIFNEKEADELIVLDISASSQPREPDYRLIERLANECRMPLCYGGGIKTLEQANRILAYGVEKVAVSSLAVEQPTEIRRMADYLGNQSVVVAIDTRKQRNGSHEVYIHNGKKRTGKLTLDLVKQAIDLGAGEILLNAIDNDGMMAGYDTEIIDEVRKICSVPLTVLGGCGAADDISQLIKRFGIIGVAAGSFFIYKGKLRGVLISYPNTQEKEALLKSV